MAQPVHVYRLSDCVEQIYSSSGPVLLFACNDDCRSEGRRDCIHKTGLAHLADLPLAIVAVARRDLQQIPLRHHEASWGQATLLRDGRVLQHWPRIPTPAEVGVALAALPAPRHGGPRFQPPP